MSSSGTRSPILRAEVLRGEGEITCALELTDESVFIMTEGLPSIGDVVPLRLSFPRAVRPVVVRGRVRQVRMSTGPGTPSGFVADFELEDDEEKAKLKELARAIRPSLTVPASRELALLLVEDNQLIRDMFAYAAGRYFGPRGRKLALAQAATVSDAWAHLARARFDVLIVDHFLPDATGSSFVSELRKDVMFRGMPIVGMSVGGGDVRAAMLGAGADLFLQKPIVLKDLFCTLEFLMSCEPGSERGAA